MRALLLTLCLLLGQLGAAAAETLQLPETAERGQFFVSAERGLSNQAGSALDIATEAMASTRLDLPGLPKAERIDIRLVKQMSSIPDASPAGSHPPSWARGVAFPRHNILVVAIRREHERLDWESTLRHEISHLALNQAIPTGVPRWLDEGFAFQHARDLSMDRVRTLTSMSWSGSVYSLAELERSFPAGKSSADRAYAQSYDFVGYLARRGRYADTHDDPDRWTFRDFLGALAEGQDVDAAAKAIYGVPLDTLAKEWYEDLRKRYWMLPVGLFGGALWLFASIILVLAYRRKRRLAEEKLALWAEAEDAADHRDSAL